jgi:hypothetical protein
MPNASVPAFRRALRASLFAPLAAFALGLSGCGGTDQSTGPATPAPTINEANKNMEDFMKAQGNKAPGPPKK